MDFYKCTNTNGQNAIRSFYDTLACSAIQQYQCFNAYHNDYLCYQYEQGKHDKAVEKAKRGILQGIRRSKG